MSRKNHSSRGNHASQAKSGRSDRSSNPKTKTKPATPAGKGDAAAESNSSGSASVELRRAELFRTQGLRETVEAFVVAFVLALLFRAFVAEAFVIPTGSMAPTLMGAHKEIDCDQCGQRFRIGASIEQRYPPEIRTVVVGGMCPNCRYVNAHDLVNEPDDVTFNGDRILVSKFAYAIHEPERWDVIVFKFPGNPKQNYIKRLVGLPNETVSIEHGDVFVRPTGTDQADQIVRKPPGTLLEMSHLVYDSANQPPALIQADYPSKLQPWRAGETSRPKDSWQVERSDEGLTATLNSGSESSTEWLRYYHRWPDQRQWAIAMAGESLAEVDPYSSRAITDYYPYNAYFNVPAGSVYDVAPATNRGRGLQRFMGSGFYGGEFKPSFKSGAGLEQFRGVSCGSYNTAADGLHWVGDLIVQSDIELKPDAKRLTLELVEAGVRHQCEIDLSTGTATLLIGGSGSAFGDGTDQGESPTAQTALVAGSRHQVRFSNCDDQLLLWIDDELVEFDRPTVFERSNLVSSANDYPHFSGAGDPLDAAPVAIGVSGGGAVVHRVRIDRDKYYIATQSTADGVNDYQVGSVPSTQLFASPSRWDSASAWASRRRVSFVMEEDQFFPMGDNSPESLDARCWAGSKEIGQPRSVDPDAYRYSDAHYVPRDLLVGKALVVFWPHPWSRPVPFTPNFKRMKLIR